MNLHHSKMPGSPFVHIIFKVKEKMLTPDILKHLAAVEREDMQHNVTLAINDCDGR